MPRILSWLRRDSGGEVEPEGPQERLIRVASLEEVPPGAGKVVTMMGREVGLFNVKGDIRAVDNICPHSARSIGVLGFDGKDVTCLWHGLKFDLETGVCPAAPHYALRRYPVRIQGTEVYLGRPE